MPRSNELVSLKKLNLTTIFPNGSSTFYYLNRELPSAESQSLVRNVSLATGPGKKTHPGRCTLRYTSYRRRLLDPENCCTKYFTDALRYLGWLRDDTLEDIKLEVQQKKVERKNQEKTLIEIIYP
jgi:hypothetical protein